MRVPQGYVLIADPDHPTIERDTITCGHCQRIVEIKPGSAATVYLIFDSDRWQYREEPGAFCKVCMRPVCLRCHDVGTCTPWERMLEKMEAKGAWWRRFLHLGG